MTNAPVPANGLSQERIDAILSRTRDTHDLALAQDALDLLGEIERLRDALTYISEETAYASGGNYAPDVARWARNALEGGNG